MSLLTRPIAGLSAGRLGAAYRLVWRWHFYAGLFCLPFIVVLSLSGAVYLFKPQIDAFLDRGFDHLSLTSAPRSLDDQVEAALAANSGARLKALQLRDDPTDAARVHLTTPGGRELRVLVRPDTLAIIETQAQRAGYSVHARSAWRVIDRRAWGDRGRACRRLGHRHGDHGPLFWWPRSSIGFAGVFYPRLSGGGEFSCATCMESRASIFRVRAVFPDFRAPLDQGLGRRLQICARPWTGAGSSTGLDNRARERESGSDAKLPRRAARARRTRASDEHAEHRMDAGEHAGHMGMAATRADRRFRRNRGASLAARLADPVLISPPSMRKPNWVARSDAQNRTLRATYEFDPKSFEEVKRVTFADRALIDRVVGIGVAAHEGQLFGWFNQLLGLLTASATSFSSSRRR